MPIRATQRKTGWVGRPAREVGQMILDNYAVTVFDAIGTGAVDTRALATVMQDEQMHRDLLARTPMGRAGKPEDIACAAPYLASPASSWVPGAILNVDGGSSVPAIQIPVPTLGPRATR